MELGISPTHILGAAEPVEDAVEAPSPGVLCLELPALCLEPEELQPVSPDRDTIRRQASYIQAEPSSTSPAPTQSASIYPASNLMAEPEPAARSLTATPRLDNTLPSSQQAILSSLTSPPCSVPLPEVYWCNINQRTTSVPARTIRAANPKLWEQVHQSVLTLTRRGQDCQVEVRWYHSNGFTPVLTWGSETAPVVDLTPLRLLAEIVRIMQE